MNTNQTPGGATPSQPETPPPVTAAPLLSERRVVVRGAKIASAMNTPPRSTLARVPLVVLPEIGFTWRDYRLLLEHYAPERKVFALDWPGIGDSEKPLPTDFSYSVLSFAEIFNGWMDALGIGRAVLLGNGIGAMIALLCTGAKPKRVLGLVEVGPLGFARPERMWRLGMRMLSSPTLLRRFEPTLASLALGPNTPEVREIVARHRARRGTRGYAASMTSQASLWNEVGSDPQGLREAARKVQVPGLVIRGALDPLVSAEDSQAAAAALGEHGTLEVVLPEAGHLPFLQQGERFYTAVSGLLQLAEVNAGNIRNVR